MMGYGAAGRAADFTSGAGRRPASCAGIAPRDLPERRYGARSRGDFRRLTVEARERHIVHLAELLARARFDARDLRTQFAAHGVGADRISREVDLRLEALGPHLLPSSSKEMLLAVRRCDGTSHCIAGSGLGNEL